MSGTETTVTFGGSLLGTSTGELQKSNAGFECSMFKNRSSHAERLTGDSCELVYWGLRCARIKFNSGKLEAGSLSHKGLNYINNFSA